MEKIVKISFCGNDICVVTDSGKEYRKALEFFPTLKELSQSPQYNRVQHIAWVSNHELITKLDMPQNRD